ALAQRAGRRVEPDLSGEVHRVAGADRLRIRPDGGRGRGGVDVLFAHSRECSTRLRVAGLVLDGVPGFDPGIDAALQRTDALVADLLELLRDLDGGRLVRAGAVENDLAVHRHAFEALRNALHVDRARSGNPTGRGLRDRRTHVDQGLHLIRLHQIAQLVDRN